MIDHLLGRPNPSWKRTQVFLIMFFWVWRIVRGHRNGPRLLQLRRLNRALSCFTPWQIIASTLTTLYALRHAHIILGLGAPEPLTRLYSRAYYRATWIITGLDAGFATAMPIKTKWVRDICSLLFSVYYIIYANEADETLRKFRAECTVEMLRVTWEKTSNPYLRALSYFERPRLPHVRKLLLPRPRSSEYKRPIAAWLFFAGTERELGQQTDLVFDIPGGGFIALSPAHHEERLRRWAIHTGKPVLAIDYSKAPEYPFPFALHECFDAYRVIAESNGRQIGMSGKRLSIIMTGDSAGANICAATVFKILEHPTPLLVPTAVQLNYACLDFNFTSWMTPANMRVFCSEQSGQTAGLAEQKDHYAHHSPLAVANDVNERRLRKKTLSQRLSLPVPRPFRSGSRLSLLAPITEARPRLGRARTSSGFMRRVPREVNEDGNAADDDGEGNGDLEDPNTRPIGAYVDTEALNRQQAELAEQRMKGDSDRKLAAGKTPFGTSLAMTSRTGYFQDRIISPTMMRAMAILYVGPQYNPDFSTDYYLSPLLASNALLARFPRLLLTCGEKDPFVDDTVIFAGRVREAKRARRQELLRSKDGVALRMSGGENNRLLQEAEEDWVQMEILEGWSHGYLQMSGLLPGARETIQHLADWIADAFVHGPMTAPTTPRPTVSATSPKRRTGSGGVVRPTPDLGGLGVTSSETETETDSTVLTFVPKKRRSPPSSVASGGRRLSSSSSSTVASMPQRHSPSSEETSGPFTPPPPGESPRMTPPTKAALLSDRVLMKRRMDEFVQGLGEVP